MPFIEGVELKDSEEDLPITGAEVAEAVKQLLSGKASGVYGIQPEFLKALDVVGMSWLTRLFNITWRLGTVPLDWQTGVVAPIFKKGDWRVCSNFRGITVLTMPGESLRQGTGEEGPDISRILDSGGAMRILSWPWNHGPPLYTQKDHGGFMGVYPTSLHVFCGLREGI